MSDYDIEVYRAEVDTLTAKLMAVVKVELARERGPDLAIITSASLANVACLVDGGGYDFFGATGRLAAIADGWRDE